MPGPPPKHPSARSRRRDAARSGFVTLPQGGRQGEPPVWPLQADAGMVARLEQARDRCAQAQAELAEATDGRTKGRLRRTIAQVELTAATLQLQLDQARDAEVALWGDLWRTPQAIVWEQSHASREVAQYVRWKIRAEQGDLEAAREARMLSDRLGLNPLALLRLRLEIAAVDEAEDRGRKRKAAAPVKPPGDGEDPREFLRVV